MLMHGTIRGFTLLALGNYEMALESYNKSLEINSVGKKALNGKANALMNLGRYEDALAYISNVIRIDPADAAAWNSKGFMLEKLGRKGEANAAYAKAKGLGYIS
jgi:tetratricopeptide (TPR) repeat protein